MREGLETLLEKVPVEGGYLGQPETVRRRVMITHGPSPGPQFKNPLALKGAHEFRLPSGIAGKVLHPEQGFITNVLLATAMGEGTTEHGPDRRDPIPPTDLLPFLVTAPVVGDGDLIDPPPSLGDPYGEFRLDPKAFGLQFKTLKNFAPEDLVTGLHVSQVQVGKHIRKEGQQLVSHRMPKEKHPPRTGHEA